MNKKTDITSIIKNFQEGVDYGTIEKNDKEYKTFFH